MGCSLARSCCAECFVENRSEQREIDDLEQLLA